MNPTHPSVLERISSTIHAAEEGVVHTAEGIAEGLKHGTSQLIHGVKEEAGGFTEGIRQSNESLPRSVQGSGAMSGASRGARSTEAVVDERIEPLAKHFEKLASVGQGKIRGMGGVVEVGHELTGDANEDLPLTQEAAEAIQARASGTVWDKAKGLGDRLSPSKEHLREVGAEQVRLEHGGEAAWNKAKGMSQATVEEGKSVAQLAKEKLEGVKEAVTGTAESAMNRAEELGGKVAKEVGSLSGAAKAMDPEQPLPVEPPRPTVPTGIKNFLQQEYAAGQQEQMAKEHMAADSQPRSAADSLQQTAEDIKEGTEGIVGGIARQYGKAGESVRMKVQEGEKEAHY